nr:MAG TPA: YjcQ protein [Bacteriophage sp.]
MAKDDYYVIVYKILSYLYQCLKLGKKIDEKCIDNDNKYISINLDYWKYIIVKLIDEEYISDVQYDRTWCGEIIISNLDQAQITPKGIEYLNENSLMEKAKKFLKETKEIMPFI